MSHQGNPNKTIKGLKNQATLAWIRSREKQMIVILRYFKDCHMEGKSDFFPIIQEGKYQWWVEVVRFRFQTNINQFSKHALQVMSASSLRGIQTHSIGNEGQTINYVIPPRQWHSDYLTNTFSDFALCWCQAWTCFYSNGIKRLLEEGMATHSSILAWRIQWTEKSGWLQTIGSQSQTRLKRLSTQACMQTSNWFPWNGSGLEFRTSEFTNWV